MRAPGARLQVDLGGGRECRTRSADEELRRRAIGGVAQGAERDAGIAVGAQRLEPFSDLGGAHMRVDGDVHHAKLAMIAEPSMSPAWAFGADQVTAASRALDRVDVGGHVDRLAAPVIDDRDGDRMTGVHRAQLLEMLATLAFARGHPR